MRKSTSLSGSRSVRPTILVVSLLTIAALGVLQGLPSTAASADDFTPLAEQGLRLGTTPTSDETVRVRVSDAYGKLPLYFEANRGQTDPEVKFLSRSPKHTLFLTSREAVLVFMNPANHGKDVAQPLKARIERPGKVTGTALRMAFLGANPDSRVAGRDELPGQANYFIGNDPAKWRTNVPTFARVHYQNLYPGIDLLYYGNQRQLEYDFVVQPGADPTRILLGFQGADRLEVDAQGDLVLHTAVGQVRQRKPVIYQEVDGVRKEIPGGYVLMDTHQIGFRVAAYDPSRPLIIDPVLFYSTYVGGGGHDQGSGIAVDMAGNAYVTGVTFSTNFPITAGAFQTTSGGGAFDAFVTKLNPTGSGLVYSTYLGGNSDEGGLGIAIDAAGNAYMTGVTRSTDFPTTPGAFQPAFAGQVDAFVTKLNPAGSGLVYSTYLGGSGEDTGHGIALDAGGSAYIAGNTQSLNFPTSAGAYQPNAIGVNGCCFGPANVFVTKLNPAGAGAADLIYSTYLGPANSFPRGIAVDGTGNAYVAGETFSASFPTTAGAFQTTFGGGGTDAFVTKVNPTGTGLIYSTYLGGSGGEGAGSIAVDAAGSAYVTGGTGSANFPTTAGAFQPALAGPQNAFVTKLNPLGSGLMYSTYLGGSGGGGDGGLGIRVDISGNAYVTGVTSSTNFPTMNAVQPTFGGGPFDAFVTKLNPLGTGLVYSTYLGGSGDDFGTSIAVDTFPNPNAYVAGVTSSTDFPTTSGAFQTTYAGGSSDAFVAKITDVVVEPPPTEGKVTGGGSIDVAGGKGTFGFIVQRKETGGSVKGQLQHVNHASGDKVQSVMFDALVITGNMATFGGACTINNVTPCTFRVDVTDNGEPGTTDSFVISVIPGSTEGGMLRSGNIQIHK